MERGRGARARSAVGFGVFESDSTGYTQRGVGEFSGSQQKMFIQVVNLILIKKTLSGTPQMCS